tara:strand:+ start:439 stop:843 length:405 start_codon:yes stop_codon:yes gene_type:complete
MPEQERGERTTLGTVCTFADGAAVRTIGAETFRVCQELVDEMVTVSNDDICAAIKDGFTETRSVLEPAGALGIAGVSKWVRDKDELPWVNDKEDARRKTYVVIASGANIDFDRLQFVSEKTDDNVSVKVELPPA